MEPWDKDKAQAMRDQGMAFAKIGEVFGITDMTVMCRLDEKYAEYRRQRINRLRGYSRPVRFTLAPERRPPKEDVAARLAEIPPDTRSLTGRIFGDPLPGRSAFDRHSRAETP
jgi:uncharacterized DUF497 family protein